ncbi:phage holin family protein [Filifactor villosus]|uniref:Phage holin family protein n=1 Tax=Filifactor villosus TaxID=29374 RepID=A0ABV9QNJ3_9FIRM
MKGLFSRVVIYAIILFIISELMSGVEVGGIGSALFGGLILAVLNTLVKPLLQIISLPITVLTLGLFSLVVNGIVFALAAVLTPNFTVAGLGSAILASILFTILNVMFSTTMMDR